MYKNEEVKSDNYIYGEKRRKSNQISHFWGLSSMGEWWGKWLGKYGWGKMEGAFQKWTKETLENGEISISAGISILGILWYESDIDYGVLSK